jgi:hypothetical protein
MIWKITVFLAWISDMFARKQLELPQIAIKQVTDTFILKGIAFECHGRPVKETRATGKMHLHRKSSYSGTSYVS